MNENTRFARRRFLRGAVATAVALPIGGGLAACADTADKTAASVTAKASGAKPRDRNALFDNEFHDEFGQWPVGYIPAGGADMGDIVAVAEAVGNGDDSAFYQAWMAAADAKRAEAEATLAAGHRQSARDLYLRASCFYAASYHPLYGKPVDPRLLEAFDRQMSAFRRGMELSRVPVRPLAIPFQNTEMPAYLIPAVGYEEEKRPLIIFTNGYDATITDLYFASGVAAIERGYHVLLFDGPGQGEMLYRKGIPLRPDWEVVISAVVDYAVKVPIVDPKKIVLSGWSLGGYLAPRAASVEQRLAACVADPGQADIGESMRDFMKSLGIKSSEVANLDSLSDETVARIQQAIESDRKLRWIFMQRGMWVNGATDVRDFVSKLAKFNLNGRLTDIRCPTLLTAAQNDPLTKGTEQMYEQLTCPKQLLTFTAAEGAGSHCEMANRSLLNQRVLDWLDDTLSPS